MPVIDRSGLEQSPLADLHAIASELGLDGFRRLRKAELVERILERHQGSEPGEPEPPSSADATGVAVGTQGEERAPELDREPGEDAEETAPARRRRRGRSRGRERARETERAAAERPQATSQPTEEPPVAETASPDDAEAEADGAIVTGVVELLAGGAGFLRVSPPEPSDEDVYISAAQIRRCELVSGDRVSGPLRRPRRSERYPSLIRVDTINGAPAEQVAQGTRFEELPAAFPDQRLTLGDADPSIKDAEWLTPFGRGSRVTVVGAARSGKTEALRRIAVAIAREHGQGEQPLELFVALCGARPEELNDWALEALAPTAVAPLGSSPELQTQALERTLEQAKRVAARGGDALLLVDGLGDLAPAVARRVLAAARNIVDGGSLTVLATAPTPVGGETTVIALDYRLAAAGRFPALDLAASGTMRAELLVGQAGAEAIAKARAEAAA